MSNKHFKNKPHGVTEWEFLGFNEPPNHWPWCEKCEEIVSPGHLPCKCTKDNNIFAVPDGLYNKDSSDVAINLWNKS